MPKNFLSIETANIPWREWQLLEVSAQEGLNQLSEYQLTLISDAELPLSPLLGRQLTFFLGKQAYSGIVAHAHTGDLRDKSYCTRLTLRPRLYLATLHRHSRIFEHLNVLDIVQKIIVNYLPAKIAQNLFQDYPKIDYCVQYQETDFEFLSRILAKAGISYYFEHAPEGEIFTLFETPHTFKHENLPVRIEDCLQEEKTIWGPGPAEFKSYDWRQSKKTLINLGLSTETSGKSYLYFPGICSEQDLANLREGYETSLHVQDHQFLFENRHLIFPLGRQLFFEDEKNYFLWKTQWTARDQTDQGYLEQQGSLLPLAQAFAPPFLETQIFTGLHAARVTEAHQQELSCHPEGSISTQYPWDQDTDQRLHPFRLLEFLSGNETGTQFYPRAEQEVLLTHIEGQAAEAVIVGSLYDLHHPLPYAEIFTGYKTHIVGAKSLRTGHQVYWSSEPSKAGLYLESMQDYRQATAGSYFLTISGLQSSQIAGNYMRQISKGNAEQTARAFHYQVGATKMILQPQGLEFKTPLLRILVEGGPEAGLARCKDLHDCPASSHQIPHQGGPILEGMVTVTVNGQPLATTGHELHCQGPQDQIAEGATHFLVHGKPAAYLHARTAHGGTITSASSSVMLGKH